MLNSTKMCEADSSARPKVDITMYKYNCKVKKVFTL